MDPAKILLDEELQTAFQFLRTAYFEDVLFAEPCKNLGRNGTQPGKRTLTAMFGVKPVHVQTVLSASGQGGCTFDASFTRGAPLPPGADKYIVVWYPDQQVVSLADAYKASHRLHAAGVVKGEIGVGIRVVENSSVAQKPLLWTSVAPPLLSGAYATASRAYRLHAPPRRKSRKSSRP